ncbi:hypothetical protein C8Q76DRAFT_696630 [Earliella scabrosa]|nr:hypothetical protein C8Q76DRAFT_696630 [Earliella scabrosa]
MSALSLPLPALPALDNSYGALLLGTFAGLMLYGDDSAGDSHNVRFIGSGTRDDPHGYDHALLLCLLSQEFSEPDCSNGWNLLHPLLTGLIMVFAQIFFARRLYLVGPKYKAVVLVAIVFLAGEFGEALRASLNFIFRLISTSIRLGFAAAATIQVFTDKSQEAFYNSVSHWFQRVSTGWLESELHALDEYTGSTDSVLDMLVIYAINTGLVTGVFNILSFSLAAAYPRTFIEGAFNIVTARLYANTFLAVLNSRKLMFTHGVEIFDKVPMGHNIFARANRMATAEQWNVPQLPELLEPPVISIKVTTETEGSNTFGANSVDSELTKPLELTERMGDVGRKP